MWSGMTPWISSTGKTLLLSRTSAKTRLYELSPHKLLFREFDPSSSLFQCSPEPSPDFPTPSLVSFIEPPPVSLIETSPEVSLKVPSPVLPLPVCLLDPLPVCLLDRCPEAMVIVALACIWGVDNHYGNFREGCHIHAGVETHEAPPCHDRLVHLQSPLYGQDNHLHLQPDSTAMASVSIDTPVSTITTTLAVSSSSSGLPQLVLFRASPARPWRSSTPALLAALTRPQRSSTQTFLAPLTRRP
ncbi:hypothetical protein E1301_Tti009553 [Triplophysa tibetana]|uniref:Uncharacterized protein n=1 Tax=Triplophysa tibetana TaxID=1572043 RepID=A0A5A9NGH1_9TELE|nr:hypothetical protein E1301_Tti009553 [Triplophysa tibetana]